MGIEESKVFIRDFIDAMRRGDSAAVEATSRGMHASGKLYASHYHFLFHLRDGRIAVMKKFMDTSMPPTSSVEVSGPECPRCT